MQADTGNTEFTVECPVCSKSFVVDAPKETVRVQATVVSGQGLTAQGHRAHHPLTAQQRKELSRRQERRAKLAIAAMLAGGPLLLGGMVWVVGSLKDARDKETAGRQLPEPKPDPEILEILERARAEQEKLRLEAKKSEERTEAANKAWRDEKAREEQAQARIRRTILRDMMARDMFNGDFTMAEEAAREFEEAEKQVMGLYNDGILANEPSNPAAKLQEVFLGRLLANRKILAWAQGRSFQDNMRRIFEGGIRGPDGNPVAKGSIQEMLLTGKYSGTGSAFWVSKDGWLLTNAHVTGSAATVDLRTESGKIISARVVKTDKAKDLALLKTDTVPEAWLPIYTGKSSLKGCSVTAAGFPRPLIQGLECKVSNGAINSDSGFVDNPDVLQCDVAIFPGNSGGPLVETRTGLVVGVISSQIVRRDGVEEAGKVSYAVKGNIVGDFISKVPEARQLLVNAAAQSPAKPGETVAARASRAAVMVLVK
jgi:hypothetical protein